MQSFCRYHITLAAFQCDLTVIHAEWDKIVLPSLTSEFFRFLRTDLFDYTT